MEEKLNKYDLLQLFYVFLFPHAILEPFQSYSSDFQFRRSPFYVYSSR